MHILLGGKAFANFRLARLLQQLQAIAKNIATVTVHHVYLLDLEQHLSADEQLMLQTILPDIKPDIKRYQVAGAEAQEGVELAANCFSIVPRIGTISPWSTKATDILRHCGLEKVNRIEAGLIYRLFTEKNKKTARKKLIEIAQSIYDPMTESICLQLQAAEELFNKQQPQPLRVIDIINDGIHILYRANHEMGLALSDDEIEYLYESYLGLNCNPTDAELMMFAQANSEHCRHKIFNADWRVGNQMKSQSLFAMIRSTHKKNPQGTLVAYDDNAAVLTGHRAGHFFATHDSRQYQYQDEPIHILAKVETHNHPTAIAPFQGAATGSGGEIRDEAATGRGAKSKAGLCGFSVSNLQIPGLIQPWEKDVGKPNAMASALDIMLAAPLGAASFNNEFGRPNLCGYFRSFLQIIKHDNITEIRGYHKPIMLAGGMGTIRDQHVRKKDLPVGSQLIVLGGLAMKIGLGGGAASSMAAGEGEEVLDFASVQRSNPEMQRRAQEVINQCWALGDHNPILSIHDVGAGGLANAVPELLHASARGGDIELRTIPNDESGMSPMAIWCNESQERYVIALKEENVALLSEMADRERCPFAVIGEVTETEELIVGDGYFSNLVINIPMPLLFGKAPKMLRDVHHHSQKKVDFVRDGITLVETVKRVLHLPTVASKSFLITIGDRSIGGLVVRDQMIGPWQVPVADCAVTCAGFESKTGEAMAMGERTPIALLDQRASAKMAVAEAITNIAASPIEGISQIKLSANWMAACGYPGEDAGLYDAVYAVANELCSQLGISIPVGKDSLSMRTQWEQDNAQHEVVAPLSLIVSAFSPVYDITKTLTPELITTKGDTDLILIDLGKGKNRLGASALAQVYNQLGHVTPDVDDAHALKMFFNAMQQLNKANLLLAYHDRSDGGLFVTLCEMAFAAHVGLSILLNDLGTDPLASLFNEELGAVIQVRHQDCDEVLSYLREYELVQHSHVIGTINSHDVIEFYLDGNVIFTDSRINLQSMWSETSYRLQALRDNPDCAKQEFQQIQDRHNPGLSAKVNFKLEGDRAGPFVNKNVRPKVAILREQGINGHIEMAAAFDRVGFDCIDVHMSDILAGQISLAGFSGLVACGGFSYGDVLGAGRGWAKTILYNQRAYDQFSAFFLDSNTFALGVCNGCQMLTQLKTMIPGSEHWPTFISNRSEQFESRLVRVIIEDSPSLFFKDMSGSLLPVVVAHGEGRIKWSRINDMENIEKHKLISMRYVDNYGHFTERYPANPNGSQGGVTGLTTRDGRITIMMPHPERVVRTSQLSWHPDDWDDDSPWLRMFANARSWIS